MIQDPTWGWCCWALATYGCRPAEVICLRPAEDGTAQVLTNKRKGKLPIWRTALALPLADGSPTKRSVPWDVTAPVQHDSATSKLQWDRWQGWLRRRIAGDQLYDLRHAWAIRSISKVHGARHCVASSDVSELVRSGRYCSHRSLNKDTELNRVSRCSDPLLDQE